MGGLNLFSFYYKIVQKCNSLEQYFNFAFKFVAHNQGQLLSFIGTSLFFHFCVLELMMLLNVDVSV